MSNLDHSTTIESVKDTVESVEQTAEDVAKQPMIRFIGRIGYATKGIVYLLIGMFAMLAVFGQRGGEATDRMGIMQNIAESRFGFWGLVLLGLGLLSYAIWQVIRGLADVDNKGRTLKGIGTRAAYIGIGLSYFVAAISVGAFLLRQRQTLESDATRTLTARVLTQSWGNFLIAGIGAGIAGFAVYLLYQAYSAKFKKYLDLHVIPADRRGLFIRFDRIGYGIRGVVFAIIAFFFFRAATSDNSGEIKDFDEALTTIAQQTYGTWLLAIVALGLIAYGLYALVESRYRSFYPEETGNVH